LFAQSLGKTTKELFDLISSGQITGREIEILAAKLNQEFGGIEIKGFNAELARLKNALDEAYTTIGDAGALTILTKGLQLATVSASGALAVLILFADTLQAIALGIASGNFKNIGFEIEKALLKAAEKTDGLLDSFLGVEKQIGATGTAGEKAGTKIKDGMESAALSSEDLAKASKDVDAVLKELGIDPKQFEKPIETIISAFERLANNPAAKGEQILSGLLVTLDKIASGPEGAESIDRLRFQIENLFQSGRLTAEQYAAAVNAVAVKQDGLWDSMIRTTDAGKKQEDQLKKQADEMKRAEEAARQYELKLLELASNERIKVIEARVQLNIADLQEQTKRVEAAFASINNTVTETSDNIGTLSALFVQATKGPGFTAQRVIADQLEEENKIRREAFDLQKELTKAQIDEIRARAQAFTSGNPLIQIDGAGLQPHLEAFMWEILKTIQTRVNADGLELLLGA
jgi:hypothetical protein